jgi:hypothetical protein
VLAIKPLLSFLRFRFREGVDFWAGLSGKGSIFGGGVGGGGKGSNFGGLEERASRGSIFLPHRHLLVIM